jgi:hypothetical protein
MKNNRRFDDKKEGWELGNGREEILWEIGERI